MRSDRVNEATARSAIPLQTLLTSVYTSTAVDEHQVVRSRLIH
jgi:hypothetical protein